MDTKRELEREELLRPEQNAWETVHDAEIGAWSTDGVKGWNRLTIKERA